MGGGSLARCLLCLQMGELSHEDLISQAFGGRVRPKIYCRKCNSALGHTIDAELSRTFGHLPTLLQIGRDRGDNQPYEVKDVQRGISLVHDGRLLSRKHPDVKITRTDDDEIEFDVTVRSKKELDKIRQGIIAKHHILEPGETFEERHPGPIDTQFERRTDTRPIRRAVTKMAYGLLCTKIPTSQVGGAAFSRTREFVKDNRGDDLASANFVHTRWMPDYCRPLHRIHITLNRATGLVVGYVMLFGIYRFTVLLSGHYESFVEWSGLDYTFDPTTRKEVTPLSGLNTGSASVTEDEILRPRQSKEFVRRQIIRSYKLLEQYVEGVEFLDLEFK